MTVEHFNRYMGYVYLVIKWPAGIWWVSVCSSGQKCFCQLLDLTVLNSWILSSC